MAERIEPTTLDLGAEAADLGLKLTGTALVNVKQTWSVKLGLEYQRDPALTLEQAVVIRQLRVDAGIGFSATGGATDPLLNAKLRLGSMEADLVKCVVGICFINNFFYKVAIRTIVVKTRRHWSFLHTVVLS